jgi:glycerophosphoryl diester phosphodiesterase
MAAVNFERQNRPAIVAHRGASAAFPENTFPSFEGAIEAGADFVELDVRMTRDGVPVILHDLDVSVRTNGAGFVHELTLAQVKELDASNGEGPPVQVPTLEEVLELLSGRIGVDIEIKNLPGEPSFDSPREAAAEAVVRTLQGGVFEGTAFVCSFNWLAIERVQAQDPSIPTGFLAAAMIDPWAALVYVKARGHQFVLPQVPGLLTAGRDFVEAAHSDRIQVGTWTVDDPDAIAQLFEMGVDAVATNDPASGVAVRDRLLRT